MQDTLLGFYLDTLEYSKRPKFLNKYLDTPCLARLKKLDTFVEWITHLKIYMTLRNILQDMIIH